MATTLLTLSKETLTEEKILSLDDVERQRNHHQKERFYEEEKIYEETIQNEFLNSPKLNNYETRSFYKINLNDSKNDPLLFSLSSESTSSASISASNSLLNELAATNLTSLKANNQFFLNSSDSNQPQHRKILANEKLRKTQRIWYLPNLDKFSITSRLRNKNIGVLFKSLNKKWLRII